MPVHLYGNPADMDRLVPLAQAHNLAIIEDACQAHAAAIRGKPVGSFGTGAFSFYPTKNITTGEGGAITTSDPAIAEKLRLLRSHGQKERYNHIALGYNLRMTDMQGAMGVVQLGKLAGFTEKRIANAAFLNERLADVVKTPTVLPGHKHVYHQYTIRVPATVTLSRARSTSVAWGRAFTTRGRFTSSQSIRRWASPSACRSPSRPRARCSACLFIRRSATTDLATIAREVTALAEQPVGR